MKKPLIIIAGPTAVGKTELSVALAKRINGEIISADSMQVYKMMDIGSAKISREEMRNIPHHMIDILMPEEEFNVFRFKSMAEEAINGIYQRGHIPIIAGGTGFYIQALLYDIHFTEENNNEMLRKELEMVAAQKGNTFLYEELKKVDPVAAEQIHPNNSKRVIRALEFYQMNGTKISAHNEEERSRVSPYNFCYFVVNDDREKLYSKIDRRVEQMLEKGLVDEVKVLKEKGYHKHMTSMQGLGYKEILACLDGEYTLDEAIAVIKRDTRHFAKRQLTWFRREKDAVWIEKSSFLNDNDKIIDFMIDYYNQKMKDEP